MITWTLRPAAALGALTVLVHPHPQRPEPDRPPSPQRVVLPAGHDLAAVRDHRVERDRRGDDGRARGPGAHPGGDRRGRAFPAGAGALPPRARGEGRVVLLAVERADG